MKYIVLRNSLRDAIVWTAGAAAILFVGTLRAEDRISIWADLAPGETTRNVGEALPHPPNEKPPITRVVNVASPTMSVHRPEKPNGAAAVILPGGGFARVVPDLEGTEAADWLNREGVTAFVLSYRTTEPGGSPGWIKPLQDAQRAIAYVRHHAERWSLKTDRIGMVAFSAGGQVGSRLIGCDGALTYPAADAVDSTSHRPDFAILVYPWNMYDAKTDALIEGVRVPAKSPPAFIVHTDDDRSSSLGAVLFYAQFKKQSIPAELHVYGNGGHGYGLRPVVNSQISSWPDHAAHWLSVQCALK